MNIQRTTGLEKGKNINKMLKSKFSLEKSQTLKKKKKADKIKHKRALIYCNVPKVYYTAVKWNSQNNSM